MSASAWPPPAAADPGGAEPPLRRPGLARVLATALGVAAGAAAAQLGIAYGLAILLWSRPVTDSGDAAWAANLTWVCWLAATSVVAGAVVGGREVWAIGLPRSLLTRVAVVLSAAAGALATVPLVAIPARYAEVAADGSPAFTAARLAVLGVLLGAMVSVGVLLGRPMAWNTIATAGWLWLVAFGSVLLALAGGDPPGTTRLAIVGTADGWLTVTAPMLLSALVIGAGTALLAKRDGRHRVSVAVCGAPGPLLVGVAYLVAGPGSRPETGEQFLPYLAAPYAILTGLLGSLLVAAIEWPEQGDDVTRTGMNPAAVRAADPAAVGAAPQPGPDTLIAAPPEPPVRRPALGAAAAALGLGSTASDDGDLARSETQLLGQVPVSSPPDPAPTPAPPSPAPTARTPVEQPLPVPQSEPPPAAGYAPPEPEAAGHGWDDDEERWLSRIKGGDDDARTFSAAPLPEVDPPRRRRWSLFGDDDEPAGTGQ